MCGKWCCLMVVLLIVATVGYCSESGTATLETVRALVARNEALLNPIKMSYTVKKSRTGEQPPSARRGRSYSHVNCVWAQSGDKHYAREDYFYSPNEPARSTISVIDSQSTIRGDLPDLMKGYITPKEDHDWYSVPVAKLGLRPFEGHYTLSQILVPEYASLHKKTEMINGRETFVIDAKRPIIPTYFARIWIDRQHGTPLRIYYFGKHPNWSDVKTMGQVDNIKLHQLSNGGWAPVQGVRSINFLYGGASYEPMTVDVKSITIRREDIPESLFRIDFPNGAGIYDVTSGLTTIKGRPLKTYEQIVKTDGSYIAGMIVDGNGTPIPGVIVGPSAVRTKQNLYKLIQGHDRPCVISDATGCFAVELDEDGSYDFLVFPEDFVDIRIRNVPLGKHDLKITLRKGGTVTGRVMCLGTSRKTPVANVEVTAQTEGRGINDMRFGRMRAKTDSDGKFQVRYLDTLIPKRGAGNSYAPLAWQITCGSESETVLFEEGQHMQEVELVLKPSMHEAIPLVGRTLPGFEGIKIDLTADRTKGKIILICFFDMDQRPSRNHVMQLAEQAQSLEQKSVALAAVQAVKMDESTLRKWVEENNFPFPVGMIQDNEECIRFDWAVCSLPWLILTDRQHIVINEGFGIDDLGNRIRQMAEKNR